MTLLGRLFGGKAMATLSAGTRAPQFELPMIEGGAKFSLQEALAHGPVLLAFFKISCPVCQYAFPFFERIHKVHGGGRAITAEPRDKGAGGKVTIIGISQNEAKDTKQFLQRFGVTFPVLLDDTKTFPVSNAYGLTSVPTAFWIGQDGEIEISSVGWSKADVEEMARRAAAANNAKPTPVFQLTEHVADFRAG
jgi:peroxiredoxin